MDGLQYQTSEQKQEEEFQKNDEKVRFAISIEIPKQLHSEIKEYAKNRRIPVATFTYQIILDYLKNHPIEDPYFKALKEKAKSYQ
jgi:hypothetical protein